MWMRKGFSFLVMVFLISLALLSCSSDTAWRRSTIATYELVGAGLGTTQSVTAVLRSQGIITDAQVLKVKEIYAKARQSYILAGNTLKLAGQAESAAKRDALLAEYDKLLAEFNKLAQELFALIQTFKKVSFNDVKELIMNGGEV